MHVDQSWMSVVAYGMHHVGQCVVLVNILAPSCDCKITLLHIIIYREPRVVDCCWTWTAVVC